MNLKEYERIVMKTHENERTIIKTEYLLLKYLKLSLQQSVKEKRLLAMTKKEWEQFLALANRHEVLPLLSNILELDKLPEEQRMAVQLKTAKTVHKGIQLQVLNAKLTALLEKEGIIAVTLKGCTVARFYPVPEFRKTSDIDLFVDSRKDAERAVQILCENGFMISEKWHANHHFILISKKKEVVELHTSWAEVFKEKNLNQYLEKLQRKSNQYCHPIEYQGLRIYAYETAWQGYYLMIHMLQHFVGCGFGLRNLCDWVVLWEHCDEEKVRTEFWKMVCDSGTVEFAKAITAIGIKYLGLDPKKSPVPVGRPVDQDVMEALLRDVLDAGEFGYSEAERMVGMDGDSLAAYVREFHHQMNINFPKAGRIIFLWPVLWIATLIRFLKNNKELNRAPITAIIKKAGKRGWLVRRLMIHEK